MCYTGSSDNDRKWINFMPFSPISPTVNITMEGEEASVLSVFVKVTDFEKLEELVVRESNRYFEQDFQFKT